MTSKLAFTASVVAVQPRIRLHRSFDQQSHSYTGYVLRLNGQVDSTARAPVIAIGKSAQEKHSFRAGDTITGEGEPIAEPETEVADLYKVTKLKVIERRSPEAPVGPPWTGTPPALEVYRARGHRRLDTKTFASKCSTCIWACEMAVELTIDQWNPGKVRWRRETFCYGPKSCKLYRPGPTRKVPGRNGMSWTEEDWVDEEATSHRGPHE